MNQFFYDGQIRRFLTQFIRAMSGYQVEFTNRNGGTALQRVPVIYGDSSRNVAQIINNNSPNTTPTVPVMAVYISDLKYDRERVQEPTYVGKMHLREREFDPFTGTYTTQQSDIMTVERLMPVPYKLTLKLDIWVSNTDQKLQLVEQISSLFNPAMEIQSTDNYIDWTSLTAIFLTDINYTSRTIPIGTENPIDIATLTFELPIWISPPAKVKRMGVIQKIIASIYADDGNLSDALLSDTSLLSRQYLQPLDYGIILLNDLLTVVKYNEPVTVGIDSDVKIGDPINWRDVINMYGSLVNGISQIRIELATGAELIGTVTYHPSDDTLLLFSPLEDTKPTNTLDPVDAIIDPQRSRPGAGLPTPVAGTRYLILNDYITAVGAQPDFNWTGADDTPLIAYANDIIEYNGIHWVVAFDSSEITTQQYVTNLTTATQYRWDGSNWVKSYEGFYRGGQWSIVL
jgi:hypothetical protein